ncbi:MAG TPA: alpha/beta hydrolase-fold protein [Puia sp.]|nr:alpha/beta hydrolase-fold protein [Puia sp.]
MKRLFWFLLASLPLVICAQHSNLISIGKKDSIYSRTLGEKRNYLIHLPGNYTNAMFGKARYPVLYLLDGDAHFTSVSGLVEILGSGINGTHVIPDMIVVAIPNTDRTRDLTPTHAETDNTGKPAEFLKTSGGGNNFLHFIKDELIPHIDSSYRTMPYRVFVGHSFGGITVINALYTMPETFNAYIAIDPSLWWDHEKLLEKAKTYFPHANLKGRSLYLAQANTLVHGDTTINDHFESIRSFATLLDTRNQSGLNWKYGYYGDDDHGSVPFIAEYDGLRFIFKDYHISFTQLIFHPEKLKEQFNKFSEETNVKFTPPEEIINELGYDLLNNKQYDLAIQYFQMNIDYYPQSANVYDSMGEALMNKGDTKKSIEYYQKSLQLNPANDNAKKMIGKMQAK